MILEKVENKMFRQKLKLDNHTQNLTQEKWAE